MLELHRFDKNIEAYREMFNHAEPFPHIVIDNFLPEPIASQILAAFPHGSSMDKSTFQLYEKKIATRPDHIEFPESLKPVMYALNSHEMLDVLESITGIKGLIADPWFFGAGLQQTMPNGKLGMHIDYNKHDKLKLDRRLNVLIYLNKGWEPDWGGEIQLWDKKMEKMVKKVPPLFNRCLIFATSDISWHGLPDPIKFPKGQSRKQINLYYFSNGRDDRASGIKPHWTIHKSRPGSLNDGIIRIFQKFLIAITPPIITSIVKKIILR